jgi:hypothetical protein
MTEPDWLAEGFEQNRARLRAVAYRMLGSRAEAENAVCSVMPTAASWTLEADVAAWALAGPPGEAGGALIVVGGPDSAGQCGGYRALDPICTCWAAALCLVSTISVSKRWLCPHFQWPGTAGR